MCQPSDCESFGRTNVMLSWFFLEVDSAVEGADAAVLCRHQCVCEIARSGTMNVGLLFIAVVIVFLLLCLALVFLLKAKRARRVVGVKLLQAIRMLIKHVQIQRGLMAAQFGGALDVERSIVLNAATVGDDLENITKIDEIFANDENWSGVSRHWAKLSAASPSPNALDNYEQYCKLVASLQNMMLWVSERYGLSPSSHMEHKHYWFELLSLGETLGQLRALGLIYLYSTQSPDVRHRCVTRIISCVKVIEKKIESQVFNAKMGTGNCDEILAFGHLVHEHIIESRSAITEERYFSEATRNIENVYRCFDDAMQNLLWAVD